MEVYSEDSPAVQHCLLELNESEYERNKKNIIFLSHPYKTNCNYYYKKFLYGTNIKNKRLKLMPNNTNDINFKLHLDQIKNNKVMICCSLLDCNNLFPNLTVITTNKLYGKRKETGSGWVLLMLCSSNNNKDSDNNKVTNTKQWTTNDFQTIKKVKNNIITKQNNHHGSTGFYFSFGNQGAYNIVDSSSVSKYSNKKVKNDNKQEEINNTEKEYEKMCCYEIYLAMSSFTSTIKKMKYLHSTILDVANTMFDNSELINPLYKNESIGIGCWKTIMCVNAETSDLHSEDDVTYTTITSPNQTNLKSKYSFIFQINVSTKIHLFMNSGIDIVFSGKFLVHHQQCIKKKMVRYFLISVHMGTRDCLII